MRGPSNDSCIWDTHLGTWEERCPVTVAQPSVSSTAALGTGKNEGMTVFQVSKSILRKSQGGVSLTIINLEKFKHLSYFKITPQSKVVFQKKKPATNTNPHNSKTQWFKRTVIQFFLSGWQRQVGDRGSVPSLLWDSG